MTDSLTEVPPAARRALLELANAPTVPVKVLITGGIGTGKTTVLAAARDTLRRSGLTVLACPPPDGEPPETALVIDDAQLLTDTELLRLTERVADSRLTVVAAAEAREHHRALRALTMALERDRPRISLGPLPVAEHLRDCTAGLPFLIHAVSARAQAPAQAAKVALIERLRRLDGPTLDTLLMMSLTHELGVSDVAAALGISVTDARGLVDRAHASGLIESSHTAAFLQSVHDAIAQIVGNAHHHEVETSLLRSQLDISPVSAELALRLAEHGLRDERLADILTRYAADTRDASVRCARLYRAAVHAGAKGLTVRLADALARTGDCTAAATLADDLLSSPDATERAAAVRVAASVAVHDGNTGHAAELFGWLGPHPDTMVSSAATIVFAANGDLATARATLRLKDAGPPTMAARCARNLAEGLLLTMDQPYPVAMAKLGQAIATEQSLSQVIPDSPAALVTLAAIHAGDPVRARSVIGRAVRAGADPLFQRRHLLLSGWIKMQEGQLPSASADVAAASAGTHLHRRDALWAAALQTAISRRPAISVRCNSIGMRRWKRWPSIRSICSPCCHLVNCGSRPPECARLTSYNTPWIRRSRCWIRWATPPCGRTHCIGLECTLESSPIRRNRWHRTDRPSVQWSPTARSRRPCRMPVAPGCGSWPKTSTPTRSPRRRGPCHTSA